MVWAQVAWGVESELLAPRAVAYLLPGALQAGPFSQALGESRI